MSSFPFLTSRAHGLRAAERNIGGFEALSRPRAPAQEFNMTQFDRDQEPMPAAATRSLMLWASGFGIGALVVLGCFMFLLGIGEIGHSTVSGPGSAATSAASQSGTPAAKSAANAPAEPGPAAKPAPNTSSPMVPSETTGSAPAAADPHTQRAPTQSKQAK
jgi:hypothetical protein